MPFLKADQNTGRRWSNSTGSGGNILKVAKFVVGQERRCILVLFARRGNWCWEANELGDNIIEPFLFWLP